MIAADWILGVFFFLGLLALVFFSEKIYKASPDKNEIIRKSVHVLSGAAIMCTPLLFSSKWPLFIISGLFFLLNVWAIHRKRLRSYNQTSRDSWGTAFYPLAFIILLALFWDHSKIILFTSFAVMAFADPFAGIAGEKSPAAGILPLPWDRKSRRGAIGMFAASFVILFIGIRFNTSDWSIILPGAFALALIATASELLSLQGSDNLTLPLVVAASLFFLFSPATQNLFLAGTFLAASVAFGGYHAKFLDFSGALGAFLIGAFIFGAGGIAFSIPLFLFFILSSLLTKMREKLQGGDEISEKGGQRDIKQVLANGLIPSLITLATPFLGFEAGFAAFLGCLAAATADTWATEIGMAFSSRPRSILTWKPVPAGTSGGVTVAGSFAAFLGAATIAGAGMLISNVLEDRALSLASFFIIAIVGTGAQFVDSVLGATIQQKHQCVVCDLITEKKLHCRQPTVRVSGWRGMDNDAVNITCSAFGAFFTYLALFF